MSLADAQATIAHLRLRLDAISSIAELQAETIANRQREIDRLNSTLAWLQREHPLPVGGPNRMIEQANEAARRLR